MSERDWHGFSAWQMEDDRLRVVIVPALGAKIASLVDKATSDEWLSPGIRAARPRQYGDTFTDHDMSGWDEMFPTINACADPVDPSIHWPDHGEVWALPWNVTNRQDESITTSVTGRALPYRLTRRASIQQGTLILDYELENQSSDPLPFVWAAHPLFNSGPDCAIVLPKDVTQVINAGDHARLGKPDVSLNWPTARLSDGSDKRLDVVGDGSQKDWRKMYVPPDQRINTGWLRRGRRQLEMTWDATLAPYLGLWYDEGLYTNPSTVALEPASGYYDALDSAYRNQRVAVAEVGQVVSWSLKVRFQDVP